jgi:hypothetical protein
VKTLEPLHGDRTGFRGAGRWLAEHAGPQDEIHDAFRWAAYYSGRDFRCGGSAGRAPICFVVLEEGKNQHSHLPEVEQDTLLARTGREVWSQTVQRGRVVVYEVARP